MCFIGDELQDFGVETLPVFGVELGVPNDEVVVLVLQKVQVLHDLQGLEVVGLALDSFNHGFTFETPLLDLVFLVDEEERVLVGHLDDVFVEIVVEGDFEERLFDLEVVDADAGRALHVDVAAGHEGQAVGYHDAVELVEDGVLRLLHVELEDGLLVGEEVPDEERGHLDRDRVLAVQQLVVEHVLHGTGLHDELSPVDLLLGQQLLALDVVHADLL